MFWNGESAAHLAMNTRMDDLHHRWLETPCHHVVIDEIPDPEPPPHPQPTDPPPTAGARPAATSGSRERDESEGGSGTSGPETREKDQAGSYARDTE
jgi:hypothetical protein